MSDSPDLTGRTVPAQILAELVERAEADYQRPDDVAFIQRARAALAAASPPASETVSYDEAWRGVCQECASPDGVACRDDCPEVRALRAAVPFPPASSAPSGPGDEVLLAATQSMLRDRFPDYTIGSGADEWTEGWLEAAHAIGEHHDAIRRRAGQSNSKLLPAAPSSAATDDEVIERAARAAGIAFGLACHGPNVSDALRADWDRYRPTEVMRAVARAVLAAAQSEQSVPPRCNAIIGMGPGVRGFRICRLAPGHVGDHSHVAAAQPAQNVTIRVSCGVVALYRPGPVRNPWHCYNAYDGSFIECRTDEDVASYRKLPATQPAPSEPVAQDAAEVLDGLIAEMQALADGYAKTEGWHYYDGINQALRFVEAARKRMGGTKK